MACKLVWNLLCFALSVALLSSWIITAYSLYYHDACGHQKVWCIKWKGLFDVKLNAELIARALLC